MSAPSSQAFIPETRRKALSCFNCRRRKLRCDRMSPCSRCQKAGHPSSCSYDERPRSSRQTDEPNEPQPPNRRTARPSHRPYRSSSNTVLPARQAGRLEHRPVTLEASKTSWAWQNSDEVSCTTKPSEYRPNINVVHESTPSEMIIFRGNNFKTHYYGSSHPNTVIAHFPELRAFMKETMSQASLPCVQRDLKALQVRWRGAKTNILPLTDLELLRLFPDRDTVDHFIRLYFDTFETLYRILHGPSFWTEYQMFWENPNKASPSFIILLLLMMAAVSCIFVKEQPKYIGDSAIARERAVLWIEVSELWLRRHSQKHIYLAIWQIRCLLMLAKQVNLLKKKQIWTAAGTLVREAISAGFHRDPSLLGEKISVFDQEMRRRLWATMAELELQASIDRGMPSASAAIPSDCATVLNINDEELTVECGSLPLSKPWEEITSCSFLHMSKASFSLRVTLNSIVNDPSSPQPYIEVLKYEEMITKEIEKISPLGRLGENQNIQGLPVMARTLLDVQLRQFLILLHAPLARQADTNLRFSPSMMVCFNASARTLEQHLHLVSSDSFLLLLLRHDYLRAALIICHNMYISISIQNNLFFSSNYDTFIQYVENALIMLGNRIARLGTGHIQYWYISAAYGMLRSTISPQESAAQKQQAIDRVTKQYYQVLAQQEDFLQAKERILPKYFNKMDASGNQVQVSTTTIATTPAISIQDPNSSQWPSEQVDLPFGEFWFDDSSAWTFDNLWAT